MIAATGFGGFLVRTDDAAGSTMIGIVAMDVDAYILIIDSTKRFFRFWAR